MKRSAGPLRGCSGAWLWTRLGHTSTMKQAPLRLRGSSFRKAPAMLYALVAGLLMGAALLAPLGGVPTGPAGHSVTTMGVPTGPVGH